MKNVILADTSFLPHLGRGRPVLVDTAFFVFLIYRLKIGCRGHSVIPFLGYRRSFFGFRLRHRHHNFFLPLFSFVLRDVLPG
ncbi:MAG: hypothetical protein GF344_07490 [Chitinivibrionales bacterium]|nr:hypothetical protein [Chitinivibrionales bacterium]